MHKKLSKGRVALIQNTCILCLSVLAFALLVKVFSYESDGSGPIPILNTFLSNTSQAEGTHSSDLIGMAAPFNLVATSEQGRYGRMLVNAAEGSLLHSSNLLLEALGSASNGKATTEAEFRGALEETSLFLDYLSPIPASIVAGWFGADFSSDPSMQIRYLLIAASDAEMADLYLWDGVNNILRYDTAIEYSVLANQILSFRQDDDTASGDVAFAFEDEETYGHLSPYTVLSSEAAEAPILSASLPSLAGDVDTLLSMLDFNPHSIARYNLTNGIEVVEFPRTFRVYHDGTIQYSGDMDVSSPLYVIQSLEETPTEAEAVLAARKLAEVLLPDEVLLNTEFYFTGIQPTEQGYTITFDYLVDGIPVYLSERSALEIQTTGTAITYFRLQYRQYVPQADTYHLLPLAQAVHMTSEYEGSFLTKGYVDRGGETVIAEWLLR